MTEPPLVVVVAYRSDRVLDDALSTLRGELEVLVVDNGALASTRDLAAVHGATYVSSANRGFATAVNIGLQAAAGRDVLLLNPDARIEPRDVRHLQDALRDPAHRRAAVGPLLVGDDGTPEPADWPLPSPWQTWADAAGLGRWVRGRRFVTGAVLMLRSEAVAEVGGFDERYFLYAEESDWQRRAQDAGWEVAVAAHVTAHHVGAATSANSDVRDDHFYRASRTYVRRWYGAPSAAVMRLGAIAGASRRTIVGPDRRAGRRALARQVRPIRTPAPTRPSVAHVVVTGAFAGVERSVVDIASEQHRRGWRVSVIGGDPAQVRRELPPGVAILPGHTMVAALRSLRRVGHVDVVHAHMTAAEAAAVLTKRRTGARIVATRHFAAPRGSTPTIRLLGRALARAIDVEVSISQFVASTAGTPSRVVHNGVVSGSATAERTKTVVMLQRLEPEKATAVGIRAWAASGLAGSGWTMRIYGRGSQHRDLERLAGELGCSDSVSLAGFTDAPRDVLRAAGILLVTAPAEPFGLTVVEAMAEATPVAAAHGGAHPEVLGAGGRYFAPGDEAQAAMRLVELAESSDDARRSVGEALRERQRELFTIERQVSGLLDAYRPGPPRVGLLSLEPWDTTWRRNQHLAARLVASGSVSSLVFVTPADRGLALRARRTHPLPGIEVVTPPLVVPRRLGGHRLLRPWLRRELSGVDVIWANDPVAGAAVADGRPIVYDITDDWRALDQPARDRRWVLAAEDHLARVAETVVCSPWLVDRWRERYGVETTLIGNGVDVGAIRSAEPVTLAGPTPHVLYVGTLHPSRIDQDLLCRLAEEGPGTLHLVGPDGLDESARDRLDRAGAVRHGAVSGVEVPSWLAAADVLVCPHVVDAFTLSLDAIKAYEYLATDARVVATPSSGFQKTRAEGLDVVEPEQFVDAVRRASTAGRVRRGAPPDWDTRAEEFGTVLRGAVRRTATTGHR